MKEPNYHFYAYLGAVLTLATILVLGMFSAQQPARMAAKARSLEVEAIARGAEIFDHDCSTCHGDRGQGERNSGPALNTQEFLREAVDELIFNTIIDGRPGTSMPAWGQARGGPYNAQTVEDLVAFIRSWEATAPSIEQTVYQGDSVEGAVLFSTTCFACHGVSGEGTAVGLRLNDPALLEKYDNTYFRDVIMRGRPERGMPTWGSVLSPVQIADLVAFIRSWETETPLTLAHLGGDAARGETIFSATCIACHGPGGQGGSIAPQLAEAPILAELDVLYATIAYGRLNKGMPNWGQVLSPAEINDVIAYLQTLHVGAVEASETGSVTSANETQVTDRKAAQATQFLYVQHCATCHGMQGEGRDDRPSLRNNEFVQQSEEQAIADVILNGRANTAMEGFAGELTEAEVQALIGLVRSWQ
ncbi:MAG: c-type cytochrome [Caldilineaceae bacterium]